MKRVLHIVGKTSYDGTCIYAAKLIQQLTEYDCILLSVRKGNANDELDSIITKKVTLSKNINETRLYLIIILFKFVLFFVKNNFDIIHYHSGGRIFLLLSFLFKKRAKYIQHLHCGNLSCEHNRKIPHFLFRCILSFIQKSTIQIAVSNHVYSGYTKLIKNSNNLVFIKNATSLQKRTKCKLHYSVGYLGQISILKGTDKILKMFNELSVFDLKINLLLKGDIYDSLKISSDNIRYERPSLDITGFLEKIDLLLFVSEAPYEGCPMVILESLTFDIPVLAVNTPPVKEIFQEYPLIVEDFNKDLILGKIKSFYRNEYGNQLSLLHQKILERYCHIEHLQKIRNLYEFQSTSNH
jgi:glycosyltransferase involved in cell wall biosynthesis